MTATTDARARGRPTSSLQPLLKWVGGKRQLLPAIRCFYPKSFGAYLEPFFGSGAVFFDLSASGRLTGRRTVLIDSNADLIGCYRMVRDRPDQVASALEALADGHAHGGSDYYYEVRDRRFNPERDRTRSPDGSIEYTADLAAMLIYLNRTGFNGLYRVNAQGRFNVPAGRYDRPRILDRERLNRVSSALASPGVELRRGSFAEVLDLASRGDFLYIDPPYAPLSPTASFTSYTSGRFGREEQEALQSVVIELAGRGCQVLMSNSTAPEITALYGGSTTAQSVGLRSYRVPARRAVNSIASRRGAIEEYLISNVQQAGVPG